MIWSVFILPAMSRTGIYKADKKTQLSSNQRLLKNNDKSHFRAEASSCLGIPAGLNLSEIGLAEGVENPYVGGSIPPRATIYTRSVPDTWFTFGTDHIVYSCRSPQYFRES
jgi:hypothetical protein